MKYFKFTQYIYLAFALFFVYDGITKYQSEDGNYKVSFFIAIIAFFMFFFRKRFQKKFEQRDNNQKNQ